MPASKRATKPDTLSQFVAREIADQGLTLDEVARRGGLSVATVAAIRAGTRGKRPRLPTLYRLARGLGQPPGRLLAIVGAQPSTDDVASAQDREILSLLRRMTEADRHLAERLLRELVRSRDLVNAIDGPPATARR